MSPSPLVGETLFFQPVSVCLSVTILCLLHNMKTVQAIFTKFHININQY